MKIVITGLLVAAMLGAAVLPDTSGEMPADSSSISPENVSVSEHLPDNGGESESAPGEADTGEPMPESEPVSDLGEDSEAGASADEETPGSKSESAEDESTDESEPDPDAAESAGEPTGIILPGEYAAQIASGQADSIMGHLGVTRSTACTQAAAVIALSDYAAATEDEAYFRVWEAVNAALAAQAASGATAANCVFENGCITVYI